MSYSEEFGKQLAESFSQMSHPKLYFALAVGGTQGGDDSGGLSTDVVNGEETLNNKQISKGAQGSTRPNKYWSPAMEKLIKDEDVTGKWPDFYNFITTELGWGAQKNWGPLSVCSLREIIASVNKKEYPTFSNPKAINRHIIPLISKLLHIATSREISDKAGGGNKN